MATIAAVAATLATTTATATATTNVPLCLVVILGAPLALMVVAVRLGFITNPAPDCVKTLGKALMRPVARKVWLWQGRREFRRLRSEGRILEGFDENRLAKRFARNAEREWDTTVRPRSPHDQYAAFVHALGPIVGLILSLLLAVGIIRSFGFLGRDHGGDDDESTAAAIAVATSATAAKTAIFFFFGTAPRIVVSLAVFVGLFLQCVGSPQRRFLVSATVLPILTAWYGYAVVIEMFFMHPLSQHEWARSRGYYYKSNSRAGTSSDEICAATVTAYTSIENIGYLAATAVVVDRACLILLFLLMAAALDWLFLLSDIIRSWWAGRKNQKNEPFVRVHRITGRYDPDRVVKEYSCTVRDVSDRVELQETARQMFQLLSERDGSTFGTRSNAAIWFGDSLCVSNYWEEDIDSRGRRTMRMSTSGDIALESFGSVFLDGPAAPPLGLHSAAAAPADPAALAEAMDVFFHLLAMYDSDRDTIDVQIIQENNVVGLFPVSNKGLAALVGAPIHSGDGGGRPRRWNYDFNHLGLSSEQWDCIFRSCGGPEARLELSGIFLIPEDVLVGCLISALREDRCRASIDIDITYWQDLPQADLRDLLEALERNHSVTELLIKVDDSTRPEDAPFDASVLLFFLECLTGRQHGVDVLELHVSQFPDLAWNQLWSGVVPSRALNVRRLVLFIRPEDEAPGERAAVDEELMVRSVCASTTLCELVYRTWNARGEDVARANRIGDRVQPHLNYNRFRRLLSRLENEPSAELQERWAGTILTQSTAGTNTARFYHLFRRRSAGAWLENLRNAGTSPTAPPMI